MNTAQLQQARREPAISWSVALGILIGGAAMLAFAGYSSMPKKVEPIKDRELETFAAETAKLEKELEAFRKTLDKPAADLKDIENSNKTLAESVASRANAVRTLEADNSKKENEIRAKIKAVLEKKSDDQKKAAELDEKNGDKNRDERKLREALIAMQNSVVTIVAPKNVIGTGILIGGFKTPTVITTTQIAPSGVDLNVHVRYLEKGFTNVLQARVKGKLIYTDKETGLAFVSLTAGRLPLTSFDKDTIRAATPAEELTLITTHASHDEEIEIIMFDGTVSALEEVSGDFKMMRAAVPANLGSSGAPMIASDKKLIGLLVKAVEGVEKAALAIPGPDILKAIERAQKK